MHNPSKFQDDEKREYGTVKFRVYRAYLKYSGGLIYWSPIALFYIANLAITFGRVSLTLICRYSTIPFTPLQFVCSVAEFLSFGGSENGQGPVRRGRRSCSHFKSSAMIRMVLQASRSSNQKFTIMSVSMSVSTLPSLLESSYWELSDFW